MNHTNNINTKTLITVKIDKYLKLAAQQTAEEIGIPLGTLVNSFLKQFVRTKEVRFNTKYHPSSSLIATITESEKEFKSVRTRKAKNLKNLRKMLEN